MRATIINEEVVICPCCKGHDFEIQRRFVLDSGIVENHARCNVCCEEFTYAEDRLGRPLRDKKKAG
ncbi:MAG: hypothetical protein HZA48_06470 [Planctomycetes bacterium]|nr:hypothetical protein [Planctomycetota bacterium]